MSTASYGQTKERERIAFYQKQGWRLLQRAIRTRFQREDIAGCFDLWLAKKVSGDADSPPDVDWLFVQVTSWGHRAEKLKKIAIWDTENRPAYGIMIRLDTYQPPHFEGRGKARHWVKETVWRSEEL